MCRLKVMCVNKLGFQRIMVVSVVGEQKISHCHLSLSL